MSVCSVGARSALSPARASLRVLAIDGGGIRGLIAAKVLARLEELLEAAVPPRRLTDCFDLIAGTSTGGLITLALTAPPLPGQELMSAARLADIYAGREGGAVFERPA